MKRKDFRAVLLLAIAAGSSFFLIGCEYGNKRILDSTLTERIKIGQTTKAEVTEILGKPRMVSKHAAGGQTSEMWFYMYHKDKATFLDFATGGVIGVLTPTHSDTYSFMVTFSENGTVQNITESKSEMSY